MTAIITYDFFEICRTTLSLDSKDLEQRFYALSRKWHPDRFAPQSRRTQEAPMEPRRFSTTPTGLCKIPIKRADYLLKLEGFDIGEQQSKEVPPELLEEVFELNMALEESERAGRIALVRAEIQRMPTI